MRYIITVLTLSLLFLAHPAHAKCDYGADEWYTAEYDDEGRATGLRRNRVCHETDSHDSRYHVQTDDDIRGFDSREEAEDYLERGDDY